LDVLVFDEADQHMFKNPREFARLTGLHRCICFTATPSVEDKPVGRAQRKVITALGFKVFDGRSADAI
jgi:hypothetical protein